MFRVQKLLSNYGYCSRRKAEELIIEGRVKVNGTLITIGDKATEKDEIYVDGKIVNKEQKVYLIFNKPKHCVTALTDEFQKTIMDFIQVKERVFPIGRLDFNTSGLLILTNDGDFANNVMHPRYEIKKTYSAVVDKPLSSGAIQALESGVELDDGITAPAQVKASGNVIEITIHEGKNRIVKRMIKSLGYLVKSLERTRIGQLDLGTLKPGQFRSLSKKERERIFQ